MKVTIQRWPVLERDGKAYIRTKEPLETREVELTDALSTTKVDVYYGTGWFMTFSVVTLRGIARPDWVLVESADVRALRKLLRSIRREFRKLEKVLEFVWGLAPTDDVDDGVVTALAANDTVTESSP